MPPQVATGSELDAFAVGGDAARPAAAAAASELEDEEASTGGSKKAAEAAVESKKNDEATATTAAGEAKQQQQQQQQPPPVAAVSEPASRQRRMSRDGITGATFMGYHLNLQIVGLYCFLATGSSWLSGAVAMVRWGRGGVATSCTMMHMASALACQSHTSKPC